MATKGLEPCAGRWPWWWVLSWGLAALMSLGCGAVQFVSDDPQSSQALLVIDCKPPTAMLTIDDKPLGPIAGWRDNTVPVAPGPHQIEVSHEGYLTYLFDLDAQPGRLYRLELDLIRNLEEDLDEAPDSDEARPALGEPGVR